MQGHLTQLVLYDSSGDEQRLMVSCSPFRNACTLVGCLLTIRPSEAITLQDALASRHRASALVSAEEPHAVHLASDAFLNRFASARPDALGRPLHLVCGGQRTRLGDAAGPDAAWFGLLRAALGGRVARVPLAGAAEGCGGVAAGDEVACTPVVEAPNGRIRHLLVTIGPAPSDAGAARPRPSGGTSCDAEAGEHEGPGCTRLRARGPTAIVPRRRYRTDSAAGPLRAPPVVVTRELVAALAGLSIRQAAAAAGVSVTAFKQACRRLGIRRWAYKRHRPVADCFADADAFSWAAPQQRATAGDCRLSGGGGPGDWSSGSRAGDEDGIWDRLFLDSERDLERDSDRDSERLDFSSGSRAGGGDDAWDCLLPAGDSDPAAAAAAVEAAAAALWGAPSPVCGLDLFESDGWPGASPAGAAPWGDAPAVDDSAVRSMLDSDWPLNG